MNLLFFLECVHLSVHLDPMSVWKQGGVNQIIVGSILGHMPAKVRFCLALVGLDSPFYSELVFIF